MAKRARAREHAVDVASDDEPIELNAAEVDLLDRLLGAVKRGDSPEQTRPLLRGKPLCGLLTKLHAMKRRTLLSRAGRPS